MKVTQTLAAAGLCLICSFALAQSNTDSLGFPVDRKWRISDFSFFFGQKAQTWQAEPSVTNFLKLAAKSGLPDKNMKIIERGDEDGPFHVDFLEEHFNMVYGVDIAFDLFEKMISSKPTNVQLRCGISLTSNTLIEGFFTEVITPYDTVNNGGETVVYDSVTTNDFTITYNNYQLLLDVALILRRNSAKFLTSYTGIGICAGTSVLAHSDVSTITYWSQQSRNLNTGKVENGTITTSSDWTYDWIRNKSVQQYIVYLPIGLDFNLGNGYSSEIHAFTEFRPFLSGGRIAELGRMYTSGGVIVNCGARFVF